MKVSELLATPDKWTNGAMARDARGDVCGISSSNAACWCLMGAVCHCYPDMYEYAAIFDKLHARIGFPTAWNDTPGRLYSEVLRLVTELDI